MQRMMIYAAGAVLLLGAVAQAQPGPRRGQGGPGGPGGMGGPGPMMEMMGDRLVERLNMSEDQRLVLEGLMAQHRERLAEVGFTPESMRAHFEEMQAARDAGDEARVAELRGEMRARREQMETLNQTLMNSIEGILLEDQVAEFRQIRQRMDRGRQQFQAGQQFRDLVDSLPNDLQMTPEQRAAYDDVLAERRAAMGQRRGQWQDMQALMEDLREARRAGDMDRVREIEAQLEARRPTPPDINQFFDQIRPILTPEQQTKLEEIRAAQPQAPGARQRQQQVVPPRELLQAVKRLRLSEEQQEKVREIERRAQDAERSARRDPQTMRERSEAVRTELMGILDADQKVQFERLIARARGERPERPERPGAGERERRQRPDGPPGRPRPELPPPA